MEAPRLRLVVKVTQIQPEPLHFLRDHFSGYIKSGGAKGGRVNPVLQWVIDGKKALGFLRDVRPYLILKKEEALLADTYPFWSAGQDIEIVREKRAELRLALKELKEGRIG